MRKIVRSKNSTHHSAVELHYSLVHLFINKMAVQNISFNSHFYIKQKHPITSEVNLELNMKVNLLVEEESEDFIDEEDKKSKLFMRIYKAFPNAIWQREGQGFSVFI